MITDLQRRGSAPYGRVIADPLRQINTLRFLQDRESSLCNWPVCCFVNAPLVQD